MNDLTLCDEQPKESSVGMMLTMHVLYLAHFRIIEKLITCTFILHKTLVLCKLLAYLITYVAVNTDLHISLPLSIFLDSAAEEDHKSIFRFCP